MSKFQRGTVLKLTCDVHEFLSKAPKAYEDLIDIIDASGHVKVKTHNGDYVGLYGMKAKIHTRFMKQFDVVEQKVEVPVLELDKGHMDAINAQVSSLMDSDLVDDVFDSTIVLESELEKLNPGVFISHEDAKIIIEQRKKENKEKNGSPELTSEPVEYAELKNALFDEMVDSLAKATSKLNSLGFEFSNGEWLTQEEIKEKKLAALEDKVCSMTAAEVAQLLIDNNIEL